MSAPRQRVRIQDVAAAAGVSNGLVSFALNGRPGVSEPTRRRIVEVADRLGYQVHPAARALRTGMSDTVGMIIRNFSNPFFVDLITGAQRKASADGVTLMAIDSDYSAGVEQEHIRRLAAQDVDALAIAPVGSGDSIRLWQELRPGAPTVAINATVDAFDEVVRVSPDNVAAVELVTEHLAQHGHRAIGFLTAPPLLMSDHDRLDTFLAQAEQHRIRPVVIETALRLPDVERAVEAVLAGPEAPTAIMTNSDFTAQAVYRAARSRSLRIGPEVLSGQVLAVVGHDDLASSDLLDPPLTTVHLDRSALGEAIYDRLAGRTTEAFRAPVRLVIRASG